MRSPLRATNLAVAFVSLATLAFACGGATSTPADVFGNYGGAGGDSGSSTDPNGNGGNGDDDASVTLTGNLGGNPTGDDAGPASDASTVVKTSMCNSVSAPATQSPLNIVIMLDKSGSMGDGVNGDPSKKWDPITQALESFLEDSSSTNMSASLQFFPILDQDGDAVCSNSDYQEQAVPFTSLPVAATSDPFKTQINANSPLGATPTIEALTGAINYAQAAKATDTTMAKYVILLVTDGDPCQCSAGNNGCPGSGQSDTPQVQAVANKAATVAATIPTYVIGVGVEAKLDLIAQGGGTNKALLVDVGNPATTKTELQTDLAAIRTSTISCNFNIPAPPSGQSYDISAVNVDYTSTAGGTPQTLPYDPNCTGAGWHYDTTTMTPSQIILCGQSCTEVKSGNGGSVNVEFGCETQGAPIPNYDAGAPIVIR